MRRGMLEASVAVAAAIGAIGCGSDSAEVPAATVTVTETATAPVPAKPTSLPIGETMSFELHPVDPQDTSYGEVHITRRVGPDELAISAFLEHPTNDGEAAEVWLLNSPNDAVSLGAQVTNADGDFEGRARLPGNWREYRFVDVSREPVDDRKSHDGRSLLRGEIAAGR